MASPLQQVGPDSAGAPALGTPVGSRAMHAVSPVFAGRAAELAGMVSGLNATRRREPVTILLGGEAGIGKSRLVCEFGATCSGLGATALAGACPAGGAGEPFAPFSAVLARLAGELGAGALAILAGHPASELSRLMPEPGPPPAPPGERSRGRARARLFQQMLAVLGHLSERAPVVLAIEDAHWADRSTRDLLWFLVSNQQLMGRVMVLITFRSDELHRAHPLRLLLAQLACLRWVRRANLPPLSRPETAEQMAGILAGEPESGLADAVYARSAGIPLLVEELARCDEPGCQAVQDLVLASARRLPPDTQAVLRAASAGDGWVSQRLLARVAGVDGDRLPALTRPALAAKVLVAGAGAYAFRHDLIREAIYDDLLPGERCGLHARYAEAIAGDPALLRAGSRSSQLFRHWHRAHDVTAALCAAWQAAAEAERALAGAEQLAMLSRVLELWDRVPGAARLIGADHVTVVDQAIEVARCLDEHGRAAAFAATQPRI
jgi:predicted ATPase